MLMDLTLSKSAILKAPAESVWDALTNPEKIKLYLFGTQTICDWKKGSPIVFTGAWDGKTYRDGGTILEIEKHRLLKYSYYSSLSPLPDLPENYSTLTFALSARGLDTELSLEQWGFADESTLQHSDQSWESVIEGIRKIVEPQ